MRVLRDIDFMPALEQSPRAYSANCGIAVIVVAMVSLIFVVSLSVDVRAGERWRVWAFWGRMYQCAWQKDVSADREPSAPVNK